jgi:hypothetical protein
VLSCDDPERAAGLAGGSTQAGPGGGELFVIGAEGSALRRSHLICEVAIQTLVFQWVAIVPAAMGFVCVMELLGGRESSLVVGSLGNGRAALCCHPSYG